MKSFYHQKCLLIPRAPSKIVCLAWLLKFRRVTNRTYWHENDTLERLQEHSAMKDWKTLAVTSSDKATFQKRFHQVAKALLESIFLEDSIFPGLPSKFLIYSREFQDTYFLSRDHVGIKHCYAGPWP